jgi:hypothetical protein
LANRVLSRLWQRVCAIPAGVSPALDRFVERLIEHRHVLTGWVVLIAFGFWVVAFALHVHLVTFSGVLDGPTAGHTDAFRGLPADHVPSKQVGYLTALNWSLFSTAIAPTIVWFGIGALHALNTTLRNLCERGMVRDKNFDRLTFEFLQDKWERHIRQSRALFICTFLLVIYFVMNDWWSVVGQPILYPQTVTQTMADPVMEFDWSVSSLYPGSGVSKYPLLVFGFLGYVLFAALVPALVISVTLCTVFYMLFITTARTAEGQLHLAAVPTAGAKDRHFGFKVFSDLFHNFLLMSLFILGGLWLMSVQNVYLRDPASSNIYSFVVEETKKYKDVVGGKTNIDDFLTWFFKPGQTLLENPQVAISVLLFPMICFISVVGCWVVLGYKARHAQEFSKANVQKLAAEFKTDAAILEERLSNEMDVWPVGWIKSRNLILLMILMAASMISYRVMAIPLLIGMGVTARSVTKSLFVNLVRGSD